MTKKTQTQARSELKQVRIVYSSTANSFNITQASGTVKAQEDGAFTRDDFMRALRAVSTPVQDTQGKSEAQ